jgi:ABC-2 type transport system permease protein
MNKTFIVAQRELLTRIRKKTFLLTTILLPLLIFGFYGLIIYFSIKGDDSLNIAIVDKSNIFEGKLESKEDINFHFANNESEASLKEKLNEEKIDAYVIVPEGTTVANFDTLRFVSGKKIGLMSRGKIEDEINNRLEEKRLMSLNISKAQLDSIQNKANHLTFSTLEGNAESDDNVGISYGVGFISGLLIYAVLFIYGTMVMRGVMEEKVSRIAEVIVSSVKPFQLMMGKIIGIGAVGLIQFIIWGILILGLQTVLLAIFPGIDASAVQENTGGLAGGNSAATNAAMTEVMKNISQINFPLIIGCFIFYFLGGYLLYSSLFAAVGSAVNEDPQDAQALILPITMPIIFGMVMMTKAVNSPFSSISIFGSLFPLTSPIVMMARVAHGIPGGVTVGELLLSMALLILGFLGSTWVAAKIYRTGILMYGKKVTWKEMWKWAVRKY